MKTMDHLKVIVPEKLYKYRSLGALESQFTLDIIEKCQLYWACPHDFNDPFDCVPLQIFQGSKSQHLKRAKQAVQLFESDKPRAERRRALRSALKRKPSEIVAAMEDGNVKMLGKIGICSMTEKNDNMLMWSHYADSHRGICLGFEHRMSMEAIELACAMKVSYDSQRPSMNAMLPAQGQDVINKLLLTKSEDWSYEVEWRLIHQDVGERLRPYPTSALTEIIFGIRTSEKDKLRVRDAVASSNVCPKFYQAQDDKKNFKVKIISIT